MKKGVAVVSALLAALCAAVRPAGASVLGFDATGAYYLPRDSRWTGVGVDIAVNARLGKDLEMGYRVEELNVSGNDSGVTAAGAPSPNYTAVSQITFQGVQAWYTLVRAMEDKISGDAGVWAGAATTNNFPSGATNPAVAVGAANPATTVALSSPFIEPQVRANWVSHLTNGIDAKFSAGIGYRFVRNWHLNTPFFNTAAGVSTLAASSRALNDFDGTAFYAGFGLMF